ncbi:MAG: hypothetical protein GY679_00720 [Mycoplasma sp.]|nr:hypothetical protein [Mycoplasma sp.]
MKDQALKNKKILIFESFYLLFSYIFIIWNISLLIYFDNNGYYVSTKIKNCTTNIGWMFTQFTWWTNILITILQTIRIIIRNKKINNKLLLKLLGRDWYTNWVTYISIVGTLFFAGALSVVVKNYIHGSTHPKNSLPTVLFAQRIIITIFVHLVNPSVYIIVLTIIIKEGLLRYKKEELEFKKIVKKVCFGMIYPTIYIIFYIVFALLKYDPYPISQLKEGKGIWVGPFVFIVFVIWLSSTWAIIRHKNLKRISN